MQRNSSAAFLHQVRRTIDRYRMLAAGDRVLVALSGGPDSVVLLAALAALAGRYGIKLIAGHLNHQLRGDESQRDQACAEQAAAQLGIPCVVGRHAVLAGPDLEARARQARYAFLTKTADVQGCSKIATGHTLDDQAETVLMRLLRGTGWDGLAGIQAVRDGRIIRPLLECSRAQVVAFLEERGLRFVEDSSNLDRRFLRNRVRHDVLPLLESINPEVRQSLAAAAGIAADETAVLEAQVGAAAQSLDGSLAVSAFAEVPLPLRPRLVRAWLRGRRGDLRQLAAAHVWAVVDLATGQRPNGRIMLPGGQRVVREYDTLRFQHAEGGPIVEPERLLLPGRTVCLRSGWSISAELAADPTELPPDLWSVMADAEAIVAPLVVRTVRPGDRIRPLGLHGHRKLQDLFVDRKLPVATRRICPVVEMNGEILWVPGVARSDGALVTPATRSALRLVARKPGIAGA